MWNLFITFHVLLSCCMDWTRILHGFIGDWSHTAGLESSLFDANMDSFEVKKTRLKLAKTLIKCTLKIQVLCHSKAIYHWMKLSLICRFHLIFLNDVKECVASIIGPYKNNGAVSYVGVNFLLIWPLYLARTWLVFGQFTRNKKEYLSLENLEKYIILCLWWRHWYMLQN